MPGEARTSTFAVFIYEKGKARLLRHMTGIDKDDVIRRALEWCEVYS
jgi:hypothetical protein